MKRLLLIVGVLIVSCGGWSNPVSPEYPCGTRAHQCSNGACCWNGQDCGRPDTYSCPKDMCCESSGSDNWYGSSGSRKMTKQWMHQ